MIILHFQILFCSQFREKLYKRVWIGGWGCCKFQLLVEILSVSDFSEVAINCS